jgi:hypothetical protein
MARYEEIYKGWFFHRIPKRLTFQEYESAPGEEDREATRLALEKMRKEVSLTLRRLFEIQSVPRGLDGVKLLDVLVTPAVAERLMAESDPDDPNNEFKLTVSECSVLLGDVVAGELGGEWRLSRMPNYFESAIRVEGFEMLVFQALMKKCSDDYGHETLHTKCNTFSSLVQARRGSEPKDTRIH